MRLLTVLLLVLMLGVGTVFAQETATPTPSETPTPTATATVTPTPTPEPFVYATVAPPPGTPDGQMTRFDYTASAGDVHIANLLTWLLYSLWAMFLFNVFVMAYLARRK